MKKRIIVLGNNTIAVECLKHLLTQNTVDVVAVGPDSSDSGKDGWQKSLRKAAQESNLNTFNKLNFADRDFLEKVTPLKPDFIFSFQCRRILTKDLIDIPKYGVINLHFAMLPKYGGCYPISWALLNGEKTAGVTLHYIDEGIDTGDIIAQEPVDIGDNETARELFDKCMDFGLELFKKELQNILELKNRRIPQDNEKALYYPKNSLNFKENKVDWNRNHIELYNWIRAFIFPPFQYPYFKINNEKIEIVSVYAVNNIDVRKIGEVGKVDQKGITVSAKDGNILIKRLKNNEKILSAFDFAKKYGIEKGQILE